MRGAGAEAQGGVARGEQQQQQQLGQPRPSRTRERHSCSQRELTFYTRSEAGMRRGKGGEGGAGGGGLGDRLQDNLK